jgi:hypothetical protein
MNDFSLFSGSRSWQGMGLQFDLTAFSGVIPGQKIREAKHEPTAAISRDNGRMEG